MNTRTMLAWVGLLGLLFSSCGGSDSRSVRVAGTGHDGKIVARGPNGGRLLTSGDFTLELAIFERGVPPEFRAWASKNRQSIVPTDVALEVRLTRLGGRVDRISFSPQGDFLRSDGIVDEPHSFEVSIEAVHEGEKHTWQYERFEGRTRISSEVAEALGVRTAVAGPAVLKDAVTVYGRVRADPGRVREIRARFDGVVRGVYAGVGSSVQKGEKLLTVESNESLNSYSILAPIHGVVTQRDVNPGEHTSGRLLLTITDTSSVWADLSVFPGDRAGVRVGSRVSIAPATGGSPVSGVVSMLEVLARENQAVIARVVLENPEGRLFPGTFITADVTVGEHSVPLAVEKAGLQVFRDFPVVYAQVGEEYEVRILKLGRRAGEYVEVLGGLEPDTRYVTESSYLIKADIEKSGAAHDH